MQKCSRCGRWFKNYRALKIHKGKGNPVIIAWVVGLVINIFAIVASYHFDLPTGYTIVLMHALTAILFSLFKKEFRE